jgi:transposase
MGATLARGGDLAPGKVGGHRRPILESEREWLLARHTREKDITLHALLADLAAERGMVVSCDTLWRFLHANGITFKKTLYPKEQDRPDIARRRARWRTIQQRIDARRRVFIDETWAKTNMTRTHAGAKGGSR